MSQFVESRVGDFLGLPDHGARVSLQRPATSAPRIFERPRERDSQHQQPQAQQSQPQPQPRQERSVEPTVPTADQIFTF